MSSILQFLLLLNLFTIRLFTTASPLPSQNSARTVKMPLTKINTRGPSKRQTINMNLEDDRNVYLVTAKVGHPGQTVSLAVDTGSSDIWMMAPGVCDVCNSTCT